MISLERWRHKNLAYYKDIEKTHQFFIPPHSEVLTVGTRTGDLLGALNPRLGVGIDINPEAIELAQQKLPNCSFQIGEPESFELDQTFDFILLPHTVSYLENIQKAFNNIHKVCKPNSKIILTFHNPGWEMILKLATVLKQRMPISHLNWISYHDIENLLDLENFEVINHEKRMLFPRRFPLLFTLFNKFLAPLPLINDLCLTEYVIARPRPQITPEQLEMSCSVVIPARNEAGNIESCVTRMPRLGRHTEIIFIEGHSKDNTWQEIQRVQAKYGEQWDIKIAQQKGKGKGDAVRQGFGMATGDVLMILDSDLTVRPEDLVYFFQAIASGQCEYANGCRLIYPIHPKAMPWLNRMANRFFAWLLSYLTNTKIKDSLCGTKVLSQENYSKIAANRSYFGEFDPFGDFDLIFGAAKLGLKIQDIPVRYDPRSYGTSNIQHFKEGLVLLKMCLYAAKKIKFR